MDAAANRRPIDSRIYGIAYGNATTLSDLNCPLNRYGGNNTSRYNWQLNADNRGQDWYFESIGDSSATAGERGDTFVSMNRNAGAQTMMTIPMVGWVAKLPGNRNKLASFSISKYGQQTGNDWQWFPDAGNGVLASTGQNVTGNDPNDANVAADSIFQQSWVQHLKNAWGQASSGGVQYYLLDNEHSIWHSTHRDVHPAGATMDEIKNKIVDYSAKIKAVDPTALVVGPEEWGWSGYLLSGYDQQWGNLHGWSNLPDRTNHGGQDYLPWLLSQLKLSAGSGPRPIDIFSVHYYPQGGEFGNDTSSSMQLTRNKSTRSLWDPNYVDQTWIGDKVQLIPRLRNWANTYYFPGTPVAITEYNWGAEGHINGATTQADILGIFGREGLDLAARWTTPDPATPTYKAMKLYRNYDGSKSTFGETSVSASVTNPDNLSAFAAQRTSDGALTVMVINKVLSGSTPVTLALNSFAGTGVAHVYQLTAANSIQHPADLSYSGTSLSLTVPAQSITLLILPKSVVTCGASLTGGTRQFASSGGSGSASVTNGVGCAWTAITDSPGWITLIGPSGAGNGTVGYTIAPNSGQARMGKITVGGQAIQIMEGGSPSAPIFNDIPATAPFFDYISLMKSYGITAGCSANPPLYCPDTPVTRAQMSVFIVAALNRALGTTLTYTPTPYFDDMPSTSSYFPFVQRIRDLGITAGCSTSPPLFCSDSSITQGQMAVFMTVGWMLANNLSDFTYTSTPYFTDVPATDPYFKFVQKMRDMGFWHGCSPTQYCAGSAVTRAQMAPMVMRSLLGAP